MFEIGKTYSFDIYPAKILASSYSHVVCEGVFSYQIAQMLMDVDSIHARVYPYLPKGSPDNPREYQYARFRLQDGSHIVLGQLWINPESIVSSSHEMIVVEIRDVSAGDVPDVIASLQANGYTNITTKVIPL